MAGGQDGLGTPTVRGTPPRWAAAPPPDAEAEGQGRRTMVRLMALSAVHWFAMILRMQAENELWIQHYHGDYAAQARTVGNTRSAAAALGFIITPIFAGLTDAHGRRPVLFLASAVSILKNLIVALQPTARNLIISTGLSTLTMASWELASQAMVVDVFNAQRAAAGPAAAASLGGALSKLQMIPSTMSIICPVIGGALAAKSLRLPFAVQAALCSLNTVALLALPETLPRTKRKPFTLRGSNALAALLKLFSRGAKLRSLALLQFLSDLTDMRAIWM